MEPPYCSSCRSPLKAVYKGMAIKAWACKNVFCEWYDIELVIPND